jgi:multidrug efflux system membrane fusion protein
MMVSVRTIVWTAVFGAASAGLLAFGLSERAPGATGPEGGFAMPPLEVSTVAVTKQTVPVYLDYVGSTEALRSVTLQAKVTGHLIEQTAPDGADVKQGDLLYRIDPRDYQAALDQAVAALRRDAAARTYARSRQTRTETLARDGYVAQDTKEQNASVVNQADAVLAADEAAIRTARLRLSYTEIRAPFSGRLSRSLVHEGALINGEAGTRLNTLVQLDPIRVTFSPSERDLAAIQRSRMSSQIPVEVRLSEDAGRRYTGTLTFLDNAVDRTTGTITAQATIANSDLMLLPGQYVRVRLLVDERPNALLVPKIALGSSQFGKFVYVVDANGAVEQRFVKPGTEIGELVVIDQGLSEGEAVIVDNLQKIGPGAPVRPKSVAQN